MGFDYRLEVKCDACAKVISEAKAVGGFGSGVAGKPVDIPATIDPDTQVVIEPAKPGVLVGTAAWRCIGGEGGEQILCQDCMVDRAAEIPCTLWQATRVQV